MPQIIEPPSRTLTPEPLPPMKWTVEEYLEFGNLPPYQNRRTELISGEVVEKMPIGTLHTVICDAIRDLLNRYFPPLQVLGETSVRTQVGSVPQPDGVVLRAPLRRNRLANYTDAKDVLVCIEVSDTTLTRDLTDKATLYSEAGIPEYWVIDVNADRVLVHTQPTATGYESAVVYSRGEVFAPAFAPKAVVRMSELFPSDDD